MKPKRMPRIPGARKRRLPTITGGDPRVAERESDELQKLVRALGNTSDAERIAKRVLKLKEEFPAGSIPELVTYDWLRSQSIPFHYQAMLFGGRRAKGGLVPDFVVQYGGKGMVWNIQGEYWHARSTAHGQKDLTSGLRLIGTTYKGVRIDAVVELWENDVLRKRPLVFEQAKQGLGLR